MYVAPLLTFPTAARIALRYAVGLALAVYLMRQVRKPSKWTGRFFLWSMNKRHSPLTDWGLQYVQVAPDSAVLDVGCGGGRTLQKLAALASEGRIYGIDYAKGSIAASSANNADLMQAGRVAIVQASVSSLPFPADKFDLATAVETQYFWPDLVNDMKEIRRVLKPGSALVQIGEAYKRGGIASKILSPLMNVSRMAFLSVADQRGLFTQAGYTDIQVSEERSRGWICVTGRKPSMGAGANSC